MVGRGLPGFRGLSKGTPFRIRVTWAGASAVRANAEITLPVVEPLAAASSLAACRMSASMSRVVRMDSSSDIMHQMSTQTGARSSWERVGTGLFSRCASTRDPRQHVPEAADVVRIERRRRGLDKPLQVGPGLGGPAVGHQLGRDVVERV